MFPPLARGRVCPAATKSVDRVVDSSGEDDAEEAGRSRMLLILSNVPLRNDDGH